MRRKNRESIRPRSLCETVEIAADVADVFSHWTCYERFPSVMRSVRRTKRISDRRVLWDVSIAGHQLVWDAHIVALVPDACIRWESRWGTRMNGEVRFESIGRPGTRVTVSIDYRPNGLLERIGASLGWVDACVRRELAAFRDHVQAQAHVRSIGVRGDRERDGYTEAKRRSAVHPIRAGRSPADGIQRRPTGSASPSRPGAARTAERPLR